MSEGLLSQFDPESVGSVPEPNAPVETSSLLSAYDPDAVGVLPPESTATGAFVRGAERGLLPSLGGFAAAGAGAELGALAGAAAGPAGAVVGGLAGGLAGAIGGGSLVAAAQNYALKQLPDSWVEALGQDERQQQLDEAQHKYASFLGGVAPFVLTMRPGAAPKIALPANATAVQRVMANPATARIFGGGAMGGMELGSELLSGEAPDWTKVGISTGMGLVLNRQTKLGEYLTNMGARPFRPATVAEAHDMKVMGPGVTESVFRGAHELDPDSARTASETRRAEMEVMGDVSPATPDIHGLARNADPELFARYDELTATRDDLRNWLEQYRNPDFGQIDVAMQAMEDARKAYDAHVEAAKGYTGGPEARKLRAGIREAEKAYDLLFARRRDFAKGQFAETPESAKVRERLLAVDLELRDMGRDVAAAYRRAAEFGGGDMVEPAAPMGEEPTAPRNAFGGLLPLAEGERPAVAPAEPVMASVAPAAAEARPAMALAEQKAAIADDVAQQLIAAGRPDAEAQAAGQLIAERYATRAARFDGKLGSALELYNREGARIRGAGGAAPAATRNAIPSEAQTQLPPVKDGFIRFYHGAKNAEKPGEGRWVTTSYEYARDWNRGDAPNTVWYVDIPETAPQLKNWIEDNSSSGLPRKSWPSPPHFEAPLEYMRDARMANAAPAVPSEPVAPVPMRAAAPTALPLPETNPALLVWDNFMASRAEVRNMPDIAGGQNSEFGMTRIGTPAHAKRKQDWTPGNIVDVGLVKDLLVVGRDAVGDWILVAKPNAKGESKLYKQTPHKGIRKDGVGAFLDLTKDLQASETFDFGPVGKPEQAASLLEFLSSKGLAPSPELKAIFDKENPRYGKRGVVKQGGEKLIREGGRSLDDALREATEAGYFHDPAMHGEGTLSLTPSDLLDAIRAEHFGEKLYPSDKGAFVNLATAEKDTKAYRAEMRAERQKVLDSMPLGGWEDDFLTTVDGKNTLDRAADYLRTGEETNPRAAWDRSYEDYQIEQIRAAEPVEYQASPLDEFYQRPQSPTFYSAVGKAIESAKQEKASAQQWLATIRNMPGVKPEEMKWLGLEEWLSGQKGSVTRQQIAEYVRANSIDVREVTKGDALKNDIDAQRVEPIGENGLKYLLTPQDVADAKKHNVQFRLAVEGLSDERILSAAERLRAAVNLTPPKYESYKLPGGANYRELLLTLPPDAEKALALADETGQSYRSAEQQLSYRSSHWDEPNIVSHIRFDDRTGPNGEKVLHIAEVQSDWHQEGRKKGYRPENEKKFADLVKQREELTAQSLANPDDGALWDRLNAIHDQIREMGVADLGVPDAPFKTSWPELAMKRMLRYAAENGYERISWDTGAVNAERYDLSRQVDKISVPMVNESNRSVRIDDNNGHSFKMMVDNNGIVDGLHSASQFTGKRIDEVVGKEMADKIMSLEKPYDFSGLDLKVGGEGMRGFYDEILPKVVNKLVKKYGAKVENSSVEANKEGWKITPPSETVSGKWMVKSNDYNSKGLLFETEAEAKAALAEKMQKVNAHSIAITPELEDAALYQGFSLFQKEGKSLDQSAKGKITFRPGQKPIITLMRDADASTFIHETGHDFLEQMIRDAKHEAAPDILKEDAQTIRNWLGVKSDAEIKTAHHEKFARGFEQYLREGVAPSKELAGVFAKFKQWLVRFYETIRGLGAPISDDIRGVFDRMLAEEPMRTVIAPEMERQPTIHDIHETDARLTEPAEAAPAADRVAAERERAIAEVPGDIADEIRAEVTAIDERNGTARPSDGGTSEVAGSGVKPEPVAQGGAMGAGDRAQRGGGSDAAPESAGLFPSDLPLSPRPKPILGAVEPKFVDKAGNIRVENLTTSEDVANAIHEAAIANDEFMGARRGVVSDGQVMDLAADIGLDGAFDLVSGWVKGRAYNAEQVMALRKLLVDSAQKVHAAMQKAATGSDQDVMAYAMARDRHQMIQRTVAGATAEAGRALRAFRDITVEAGGKEFNQKIKEATGKTLFQLRQEAQLGLAFDSPQQVSAFMQAAQKPNFLRMALEYFINNLISGVKSQLTYGVGGSVMSLQNFGPETAMAALIGAARKRMGREGETVRLGEVLAALKGAREGFAPALKAAGSAAKSGVSTLLPGEKAHLTPFETASEMIPRNTLDEAYKLNQVMPDLFGTLRGIREAVLATGAQLKAGGVSGAPLIGAAPSLRGDIPNIAVRGVTALPVGEAVRLPSRMNAVFDSFFRSLNYSMDKAAQAYRMAENEGLTGARFDGRVAELLANPTPEMMESSRKTAGELTLLDKGGEFTRRVMQAINTPVGGAPVLKFIAPFARVAANTLDQTVIKRTPVGLLSAELRADLMGKNGTIAQDRAQARMVMGSALSMLFGSLAAEGLITGSGPTDPKEATVWRMAGHQPHSVKVGDMWYDVRGLGPLGMLSGLAADAYDVLQKVESDEEADKIAYSVIHAFFQNLLDQSFMKGPYDLLKAVDQPDRYGGSWVRNFASAFVPFSVGAGQVARSIDPYSREARTVIDAMKAKVPGLSQELMPRRDIFGEPIPNKEGAFGNITTFYAQKAAADPVAVAMASAKYFPGKVERKIRNVDLSDQQYDDYARIAGRMAKQRLDVLVNSADFERFPAHVRHDAIKAQIDASREVARNVVMMKYPQIVQDAMDAIRNERQRQ